MMIGPGGQAGTGHAGWWFVPSPLGACLLLLALFPTDARAIRVVCAVYTVGNLLAGFVTIFTRETLAAAVGTGFTGDALTGVHVQKH